IDAPERKQRCKTAAGEDWDCGVAATRAMENIIQGSSELRCSLVDVDRYSRLIMRCLAGDTDIGEALVEQGLAMAYRRYSHDYVTAEQDAKRAERGIWQGRFDAPWDWRKKN
ncbi:MAG: thermonuclease family protein, partial [Pseudomonadota bacterium]|nr:thermonuclease family protein [Pseudomonadota bacterium]